MNISFTKFHGAGNDFIIIDNRDEQFHATPEQISFLCDRHFGIGADGLMLLQNDLETDFRMRYFNSDGFEATLCGNGGRCISAFAYDLGISKSTTRFAAIDGIHRAHIQEFDHEYFVELEMNEVEIKDNNIKSNFVNTGSPHKIVWVNNVDEVDVFNEGSKIRYSEEFVEIGGTNVNFLQAIENNLLKIRTYERGVENETLACGTGATAAALLYLHKTGVENGEVNLQAKGGNLKVTASFKGNIAMNIILAGPAKKVFSGKITLNYQ